MQARLAAVSVRRVSVRIALGRPVLFESPHPSGGRPSNQRSTLVGSGCTSLLGVRRNASQVLSLGLQDLKSVVVHESTVRYRTGTRTVLHLQLNIQL